MKTEPSSPPSREKNQIGRQQQADLNTPNSSAHNTGKKLIAIIEK